MLFTLYCFQAAYNYFAMVSDRELTPCSDLEDDCILPSEILSTDSKIACSDCGFIGYFEYSDSYEEAWCPECQHTICDDCHRDAESDFNSKARRLSISETDDLGVGHDPHSVDNLPAEISTTATRSPGDIPRSPAAVLNFTQLVHDSIHIRQLVKSATDGQPFGLGLVRKNLPQLLKVLAGDLFHESSDGDYEGICKFLKTNAPQIARSLDESLSHRVSTLNSPHQGIMDLPDTWESGTETSDSDTGTMDLTIDNIEPTSLEKLRTTFAFQTFIRNVRSVFQPTFESQIKWLVQSERTRTTKSSSLFKLEEIVSELLYSKPSIIKLSPHDGRNWTDAVKSYIDRLSKDQWSWWPLAQAQEPLSPGHARLCWKCICGETRSEQIPERLARKIIKIRKMSQPSPTSNVRLTQPASTKPPTPPLPSGYTGASSPSQASTNRPPYRPTGVVLANLNSNPTAIPVAQSIDQRFIYFMVNTKSFLNSHRLSRSEIMSTHICNDEFFHHIRRLYFANRGWFSAWFGLSSFSHCEFYRFTEYFSNRFDELEGEIPPPTNPSYHYSPKPMDTPIPITVHEFNDRFYKKVVTCGATGVCPCGIQDLVDRIPQKRVRARSRKLPRDQFWGIIARERKSRLKLLVYIAVSSIPGFILFFLWLFTWDHESLQDASVLLDDIV
ncbi:hypothetical protein F5B21DRAFT_486383 [Xylaria acuta]|nr:hypothetical protein F5B21DRAFT_486383 [Xylaria acuta]